MPLILLCSLEKVREKTPKTSSLNVAGTSTAPSPKATTKKKVPKGNKGKDSGTSSEEERWLDAIESGKLEEVIKDFLKQRKADTNYRITCFMYYVSG